MSSRRLDAPSAGAVLGAESGAVLGDDPGAVLGAVLAPPLRAKSVGTCGGGVRSGSTVQGEMAGEMAEEMAEEKSGPTEPERSIIRSRDMPPRDMPSRERVARS